MQVICEHLKKVYFKEVSIWSTYFWITYSSMFSTFTKMGKSKRQKCWKSTYEWVTTEKKQPSSNKPALSK